MLNDRFEKDVTGFIGSSRTASVASGGRRHAAAQMTPAFFYRQVAGSCVTIALRFGVAADWRARLRRTSEKVVQLR